LVSSPLQRCARFAAELGEQLNLPVNLDKDLQELHFGAWEGQSAAALMETDAEALGLFWADPYAFTPPQGEPVSDFAARVLGAVARLHQAYVGERVLLISHGGVMRLLLAQARGLPRQQLLNVEVAHASLFSLTVEADGSLKEGH
jgi:alpha-ribazole phosphatase